MNPPPTTYADRYWASLAQTAMARGGGDLARRLSEREEATIRPDWWAQLIIKAASQKNVRSVVRQKMVKILIDHPRFERLAPEIESDVIRALLRKHHFACLPLLTERGFTLNRDEKGRDTILSHINEGKWPMLDFLWPDICLDEHMGRRVLGLVVSASFLCNPSGAQGMVKLVQSPDAAEFINQTVGRCLSSALGKLSCGKSHTLAKRTLTILTQHDWMQIDRVREHARDYHRQTSTPIDGFLSDVEAMIMAQNTPVMAVRKVARRI